MRRFWWSVALATTVALAGGCRLGGPPPAATSVPVGPVPDGAAPDTALAADGRSPSDALAEAPEAPADGASAEGGGGSATCVPPFVSERCDPVCNTGCPGLSRCDVGEVAAQGVCIGIWIGGEGDLCLRTPSTDPCSPHLTCLDGRCRRLCYTDGDCRGLSGCCNIEVQAGGQPSGFRACGACAP